MSDNLNVHLEEARRRKAEAAEAERRRLAAELEHRKAMAAADAEIAQLQAKQAEQQLDKLVKECSKIYDAVDIAYRALELALRSPFSFQSGLNPEPLRGAIKAYETASAKYQQQREAVQQQLTAWLALAGQLIVDERERAAFVTEQREQKLPPLPKPKPTATDVLDIWFNEAAPGEADSLLRATALYLVSGSDVYLLQWKLDPRERRDFRAALKYGKVHRCRTCSQPID